METLLNILKKLKPTRYNGFEGLILKLLERLTGNRFYLAKSGYQAGGDMAASSGGTCIKVECKHYRKTTKFNKRDLLGEIVQAHRANPQLDLWVLVTSRDVDMQLIESLRQTGEEYGIEVSFIDKKYEEPSSLEALCAHCEDIVIGHIEKYYTYLLDQLDDLKDELAQIKSLPGYEKKVAKLKETFSSAEIGYGNWVKKQKSWLLEQFSSAQNSLSRFKQVLNVNDSEAKVIERKEAYDQLNQWLNRWKEDKEIFAILGEEGDGKTWAVASWVVNYIKRDGAIPVLFINAQDVSSEDIGQMLGDTINRALGSYRKDFWNKCVSNWMKREEISRPLILLVIDGVDENYLFKWLSFLANFNVKPWCDKIALTITCRTIHWEKYFSGLSDFNLNTWTLPPYNDRELADALQKSNLTKNDISDSLLPLIRRPRYFDMTVRCRECTAESGDITIHRLLYEDYKERWGRKTNRILTHSDFKSIMVKLAEQARSSENRFDEKDFANIIPLKDEKEAILNELVTGGVFVRDETRGYIFKVEERRLALGLGLLLYDEVRNESQKGEMAIENFIDTFLEPKPEMDFKAFIIGAAVFYAMDKRDFPEIGRFFLLKYYINLKNLDQEMVDNFQAYFPCSPETYFKLAEEPFNPFVWKIIKFTFCKWVKKEGVVALFKKKFEEWMGYLNIENSYLSGAMLEENKKKYRNELREWLGFELELGPCIFASYPFKLVNKENRLSWISSLVLSVVSCAPDRRPFIRAITIKVLKDCISGFQRRGDEISWILRISQISLWHDLKKQVSNLLNQDNVVAAKAAYYLLSFEGSPDAFALRDTLPEDLFGRDWMREEHKKDPCKSIYAWTRENYRKCLDRRDIKIKEVVWGMKKLVIEPGLPVPKDFGRRLAEFADKINPAAIWKSGGLTEEDGFLKDIEGFLFAFSPAAAAKIYRAIVRDMENREGTCLWWVVARLEELFLILGEEENNIIKKTWTGLHENDFDDSNNHTDATLFKLVLPGFSALEQLQLLLKRPYRAIDSGSCFFKKLDSKSWDWVLEKFKNPENITELISLLRFISRYPKDIPNEILRYLERFFYHSNPDIRTEVFVIVFESEDINLIESFIKSGWNWKKENPKIKKHVGNCILAEYGQKLPYDELKTRIHPNFLGYAVRQRGLKKDEVNKYAEDLHHVWEDVVKSKLTTKKDSDKKENIKTLTSGNKWFAEFDDYSFLREVIKVRPDLVQKWIDFINGCSVSKETEGSIYQCRRFYIYLCSVLFEVYPIEAAKLFQRLTDPGIYRFLLIDESYFSDSLFRAKRIPEIEALWDDQFDKCFTDISLIGLSISIQITKNIEWYKQKIHQYLASDLLYIRAKGVMMLGFLDQQSAYETLNNLLKEIPECWIHRVIKNSLKLWQYNQWAKTWFTGFWKSENDVKAWAAFKLFLKCADSRYRLWKNEIIETFQNSRSFEKRKTFLDLNESTIKDAIKKNEENLELKETFLGKKISKEIEPWL